MPTNIGKTIHYSGYIGTVVEDDGQMCKIAYPSKFSDQPTTVIYGAMLSSVVTIKAMM